MIPSTKSKQYFPEIKSAKGKYCKGVDGKRYLDFTGSNLTTILGYRKNKGAVPNFPGVSQTEKELTKLLSTYTHTNKFRFFKNGSDAISFNIRLATSIQDKDSPKICMYGYHGYNNEYASTINKKGIPVQNTYQIKKITEYKGADIIVVEYRNYEKIKALLKDEIVIVDYIKHGVFSIFMDMVGDFSCMGKSFSNGSALAFSPIKNKYIKDVDNIFFSGTYFCNQDAMLECIRTINTIKKNNLFKHFNNVDYLANSIGGEILGSCVIKEMAISQVDCALRYGILMNGWNQVMLCHSKADIDKIIGVYMNTDKRMVGKLDTKQDEIILRYCDKGESIRSIAKYYNVSSNVVKRVLVINNITIRKDAGVYHHNYKRGYSINSQGYMKINMGANKGRGVHQEVWEATHGKIPKGMVIHHKDRDPQNNNIENLDIMTKAEHDQLHSINSLSKDMVKFFEKHKSIRKLHAKYGISRTVLSREIKKLGYELKEGRHKKEETLTG